MVLKSSFSKAVLILVLVLPSVLYFIFVYSAEGNFFQTLDYVGPPTIIERFEDGVATNDTLHYSIPPYQFTNQNNVPYGSRDLRGKIYVANFFFSTCPTICPAMNYNLKQVQDRFLGYEDINFVSFTVDPEHDTVEVLKEYEGRIGAEEGRWFFLTGEKEALYKTANDFFLSAQVDPEAAGGFLHSENLVLVDWEGRIRSRRDEQGNLKAVYSGTSADEISQLKDDIKVLIAEYEKHKSVSEHRASKERD
ncbi:SCO family protein [Croceimicrobium hydrocarbonivorans]|uniref:SCO family protein n=1 Tax=Croceimicrobium hydrocarbonivorans TaxID=2761580 RepID=A0A7H0VAX2_9FLAO|nr:SCO family protein [Croceimicrobium hydrocarbonivorans]QNR22870.1 SCO family protein [Croceimicrobium hydrocarbonivorans]